MKTTVVAACLPNCNPGNAGMHACLAIIAQLQRGSAGSAAEKLCIAAAVCTAGIHIATGSGQLWPRWLLRVERKAAVHARQLRNSCSRQPGSSVWLSQPDSAVAACRQPCRRKAVGIPICSEAPA